jgi:signal transduction histidine kinase
MLSMNNNHLILIIDDIQENLRILGTILENEGYKILVATNGTDALKIVRDFSPKPSLILLDILMPKLDGFETCQRLKADPKLQHIPVIFISAINLPDQKIRAFSVGTVDYVTKPFDSEEVIARVQTHLKLATVEELRREIDERKRSEQLLQASQAKLATLTAEMSLTEERERKRIAQSIHDQVVQDLALGKLKLDQALKNKLIPSHPALTDLQNVLTDSMNDLRNLCIDLSPPLLYEMGLKSAIECMGEQFAKDYGFSLVVSGDEGLELREDIRVTLFQMARELIINMVKHARASAASVLISQKETTVSLEVVDNGAGFNLDSYREGFGLSSIRQRVSYLGGTIKIVTAPVAGTRVVINIPFTAEPER